VRGFQLRFQAVLIVLFVLTAGNGWGGLRQIDKQIDSQRETLRDVQADISRKKELLQNIADKERGVLAKIEAMDKKLALKREQLESYDVALKRVRRNKTQLEVEVADLQKELEKYRGFLAYKVVQLYKYGGYSYVKALFSAGSYTDLLKRYRFVQLLAHEDRENIDSYREVHERLKAKQQALAEQEQKILTLEDAFKEKNSEILSQRERRTRLLVQIRKQKSSQQELLSELEQSSQALQQTIEDLIRQKKSFFGDFKKYKGKLPWPLEGEVLTTFGRHKHEKFNTFIFSKGIDISAKPGEEVKAIYNGTVLFADWFKGYGQMIILDHGNGFYSVYAHLSRLLVPVKGVVEEGQPIGKAGETGSLKGPVLYFEIRYHGDPRDPLTWLVRR
jgi:septal ring factor EnvC (AmiA/AmiB activator)